ncbi:MAG TPA: aryl-sulfate sulfotransferase [Chryseosolibacter sp.]|nr:aryl-sulfate sulfotransferase [Chryseosolibacter sp.]
MKPILIIVFALAAFTFQGCTGFVDDVPVVSFHNGNALLPKITFKTADSAQVYIEYWPTNQPGSVQTSTLSTGKTHEIILLNVTEETDYNYAVSAKGESDRTDAFSFTTGKVPARVCRIQKDLIDTTQFTGYILVRKTTSPGADAMFNNRGELVWYHQYDTAVRRGFNWTGKQSVLSIYDSAEIMEVDLYGNKMRHLDLEQLNIPNKIHHDILFNEKNQIVTLTLDSVRMDLRKLGGQKNQAVRADGILVLSGDGQKVWEWNLLQKTNPVSLRTGKFDFKHSWGHANSLTIDADGNYVVSFKDFDQIWKINSVDGSIMWKLGKGGDFDMNPDDYFISQHSVHFNKDRELMIYDNGNQATRPNSRVLSFKLDEKAMKAETRIKTVLPLKLSAYRMSSAAMIDSDKYLVCTTKPRGPIAVVNGKGDVLWQVTVDSRSYRAYYLEDPFGEKQKK